MSFEPAALLLRAVGAFYIFAGIVAMRAMVLDRLMDGMLAALDGGKTTGRQKVRHFLLGGGAVMTFAGGVALALLHFLALPVMLVNALMQAAWLIYAQSHFPPEDADDARGRRQTFNAFLIYLAASGLTFFLWRNGVVNFSHAPWMASLVAAAFTAGAGWQFFRSGLRSPGSAAPSQPDELSPAIEEAPSRSLCLAPFPGDWPILDYESGVRHSPQKFGLPDELLQRIAAFEEAVLAATDVDHADGPTMTDMAAYDRLAKEAEAIVTAMEEFFEPGIAIENQTYSISWRLPGH